jgi:cation-transporting ATPase E
MMSETAVDAPLTPDRVAAAAGARRGLTEAEARARRASGQGNDAAPTVGRTYARIVVENLFTFSNDVLYGLGVALLLLGQLGDALVSVGVVTVNLLVGLVQEVRAKRILDRVTLLTRPRATVWRDGEARSVDPAEVVAGDVLRLGLGDQVVVDGVVVEGRAELDESLLTGEAEPVVRGVGEPVYGGSFCVSGRVDYEARAVGPASLANRITAGARAFRRTYTPLQRRVNALVRTVLLVALCFELLLVLAALTNRAPLVDGVKAAVVVMGLVPNGLFLATAAAYALGSVRLAGRGVLVQQANAVEALSHVGVLCIDKTGTLTTGRLALGALHPVGLAEADLRRLLGDYGRGAAAGNRTTEALGAAGEGRARPVRSEVPFSSTRRWSGLVFDDDDAAYVLGAPETLRPRLRDATGLGTRVDEWTARGLRVLLLTRCPERSLPTAAEPALPDGLALLGVVGLEEELRPGVRETLEGFASTGVRLKLISGDSSGTVLALARRAGLTAVSAVSGETLTGLDQTRLAALAEETDVFGRVAPHQKEALVCALQSHGQYVAMLGDGVNDVPALKQADLGVAFASGSQAARAVADLVLTGDSFAPLPAALREGQRIVGGMGDVLRLYLTRVLYVALLIASTAVVGVPFPFTPRQNALLTLLTVGIPTLLLAAWARPAAPVREGVTGPVLRFVLPAGGTIALVGLLVYVGYSASGDGAALAAPPGPGRLQALSHARAVAGTALTVVTICCGLLLIPFAEPPSPALSGGDDTSGDRRPALLAAVLLLAFAGLLAVPGAGHLFDLAPLGRTDYLLLGLLAVGWALAQRWIWRSRALERLVGAGESPDPAASRAAD